MESRSGWFRGLEPEPTESVSLEILDGSKLNPSSKSCIDPTPGLRGHASVHATGRPAGRRRYRFRAKQESGNAS
jgi:hypothetical protein